jgi:hypothetical protein
MADGSRHQDDPTNRRLVERPAVRLAGIVAAALTLGFLFITSVLDAYHAPSPHHVPVAVVGPPQAVAKIQTALGQRAPGAFDVDPYQSAAAARQAIENRRVDAALVLAAPAGASAPGGASAAPGGVPPAHVLIASGIGTEPANAIATVFTGVAKAMGGGAVVQDVAPVQRGDPLGVASYFFAVGLYMPSFLGGILMTVAARRYSMAGKIVAVLVFAALLGTIEVGVVDGLIGALVGHSAELIGLGVLTSVAFAATVVALGSMLGAAGIALSTLTFPGAGIPASGGPFGVAFLPEFYRVVGPGLPLTNAAAAIRNVVYFGGHANGAPLGVLACWAGGALVLMAAIAAVDRRRRSPRPGTSAPMTGPRLAEQHQTSK